MLQITFRNMPSSTALWEVAAHKIGKLRESARYPVHCTLVIAHQPSCARKDEHFSAHAELRWGADTRLAAKATHARADAAIRLALAHLERQLASRRTRHEAVAL